EWIRNKDAGANQTYAGQSDQRRSPNPPGRPKGTSQSDSKSEDEQAVDDKSGDLHPTGVADGERADGIAQGIIVVAWGTLHDPRDCEQWTGYDAAYKECLRCAAVRAQDALFVPSQSAPRFAALRVSNAGGCPTLLTASDARKPYRASSPLGSGSPGIAP